MQVSIEKASVSRKNKESVRMYETDGIWKATLPSKQYMPSHVSVAVSLCPRLG